MSFQKMNLNPGGEDGSRRLSQTDLLERLQPIDLHARRLVHLTNNIEQELELLREYEEALRYEDEPAHLVKYTRQITRLRNSIAGYQEEYDRLQQRVPSSERKPLEEVVDFPYLQGVERRLDPILGKQKAIQADLGRQRAAILHNFTGAAQTIVSPILEELDQKELTTCQTLLEAFSSNKFSPEELLPTLSTVNQALAELRQRAAALPQLPSANVLYFSRLIEASAIPIEQKLAVAIPLIPYLLSYQGEISLEQSDKLKEYWKHLVNRTEI